MVLEERLIEYLKQFEDLDFAEQTGRNERKLKIWRRGEKICLIIEEGTQPLRIELRCDRKLSKTLQERYESVMAGRLLGRNGIEIICSGQLSDDEIVDLVRHSYEQVTVE